jgi:cell fate (sporulation/competence/biofilm development) regulator YlbF (YheA/YmcA/DUF963 family)
MIQFFARDPEIRNRELVEELYRRFNHSRELLRQFESAGADLTSNELGYSQGVREEVRYLEQLIDHIERS